MMNFDIKFRKKQSSHNLNMRDAAPYIVIQFIKDEKQISKQMAIVSQNKKSFYIRKSRQVTRGLEILIKLETTEKLIKM